MSFSITNVTRMEGVLGKDRPTSRLRMAIMLGALVTTGSLASAQPGYVAHGQKRSLMMT